MRRPTAYAPLSVLFATSRTGIAIQREHGAEGLGVWAALIAAAKRGRGQIVFANDTDWAAIGISHPPTFTLATFLKTTGRMKQTRTTRHGHVVYVQLTRYEDWNNDVRRQDARERKSRNDEENKRTKSERLANHLRTEMSAELELELEAEEELDRSSEPPLRELLEPAHDGYEPHPLPVTHELLYTRLLAYIGAHGDDNTPAVLRTYANQATEGQLAKVLESATHSHARNRARYVIAALKSELTPEANRELTQVSNP